MHYTELSKELKKKNPEYINRGDKELAESYLERYPEKRAYIDFTDKSNPYIGTAQAVVQGFTAGQTPHLSGATNEVANLPQKLYRIKNFKDAKRVYKDLGKDYIAGNERFKDEYGNFEEEHPKLALGGEIAGTIGSLATGGGLGINLLKSPTLAKTILTSAGYGGLYNLSNTKDKVVDFANAGLGAGVGATLGLGGYGLSKGASKLANTQFAQKYLFHPIKALGKKILLSAEKSVEPLKHLLANADTNVPIYNIIANASRRVLDAIKRKDFGNSYQSYVEKFQRLLKGARGEDGKTIVGGLKNKIREESEKAYQNVGDVDISNTVNKIKALKNNYKKAMKDLTNEEDKATVRQVVDRIESVEKALKGEKGRTSLRNWQKQRERLFDYAEESFDRETGKSFSKYGGREAFNLYQGARDIMLNGLEETEGNEAVKIATRKYAKIKRFEEGIQDMFGRHYNDINNDQVVGKLLQDLSEKKGDIRLDHIKNSVKLFGDMPEFQSYLQDLSDIGDLLKISYAIRPADTRLSVATLKKGAKGFKQATWEGVKEIANDVNLPINQVQSLVKSILKGEVNPNVLNKPYQFARLNLGRRPIEKYYNNPISNFPSITKFVLKGAEKLDNPLSPIVIKQIMKKFYNKEQR